MQTIIHHEYDLLISFSDLLKIDPDDLPVYHANDSMMHDMINSPTERFKNMYKKAINIDEWFFEFNSWGTILEKLMEGKSAFFLPNYVQKDIFTKKVKQGGVPGIMALDVSTVAPPNLQLIDSRRKASQIWRLNNSSKPFQQKLVKFTWKLRNSRIWRDNCTFI